MTKFRTSTIYYGIFLFFILNCFISILVSLTLPGNVRFFTNRSASMEPWIDKNSLTLTAKLPDNQYTAGDIIAFYNPENDPGAPIITHRIFRVGGNVYVTKGDNNPATDPTIVTPQRIIGKVFYIIPYVGGYISFLKARPGVALLIWVPMAIILAVEINNLFLLLKKKG